MRRFHLGTALGKIGWGVGEFYAGNGSGRVSGNGNGDDNGDGDDWEEKSDAPVGGWVVCGGEGVLVGVACEWVGFGSWGLKRI